MAKKVAKKKLGKAWFSVVAPKEFKSTQIGEVMAVEGKDLVGRAIITNFSELTGELSKNYIKLSLKITGIEDGKATTEITGFELSRPYVQRLIRRRMSKIDFVHDTTLKDGKPVRIKLLVATVYKANVSKETALRQKISEVIEKMISGFTLPELILALSTNQPQRELSKILKPVYPVRFVDVRKIELRKIKREQ